MRTQKAGRVAYGIVFYVQFALQSGKIIEIKTDKHGKAWYYMTDLQSTNLYPQRSNDFRFSRAGKTLYLSTWFGLEVWHKKTSIKFRIPAFYRKTTYGLCQNCNQDKTDDYKTKDGEVITPLPAQNFRMTWQEQGGTDLFFKL